MKYLNLITTEESFSRLDYELYESKESRDEGRKTSIFVYDLFLKMMNKIDKSFKECGTYAKKTKQSFDILVQTKYDEVDRIISVSSNDPKLEKSIKTLNANIKIRNICEDYLFFNKELSLDEIELLQAFDSKNNYNFYIARSVKYLLFPKTTSWEEMKIPKDLRIPYLISVVQQNIGESIAF